MAPQRKLVQIYVSDHTRGKLRDLSESTGMPMTALIDRIVECADVKAASPEIVFQGPDEQAKTTKAVSFSVPGRRQ